MKKIMYHLAIGLAIIFIFGLIIRLFTLHGTYGLVRVDGFFRLVFIIVGGIGLLLSGLALVQWRLASGGRSGTVRWLVIPILILTVIGIVLLLGAAAYVFDFPSSAAGDIQPRLVMFDNPMNTGLPMIAIMGNSSQTKQLTLTLEANGENSTFSEDEPTTQHIFLFSDLLPGTDYSYQISGSSTYHFKTPDILTPRLHFAAAGDAHFGAGGNRRDLTIQIADQIAKPENRFDYFFSLGDLVDLGAYNSKWEDALTSLSPITSTIPIGYVPGNHDVLFTGVQNYQYFCSPDGLNAKSGSPLYYRLDYGKVHFLVLDIEWSTDSYTHQQAAWLESQLKQIPANDWKIVLSHSFYYASGSHTNGWNWMDNPETIAALTPLFEQYKVNMVFSAHVHQMELLQHSGVTYIIAGSLGGVPDPEREYTSPASLWYASRQYGFADVSIEGDTATIIFRAPDYQSLKTITINKN